MTSHKLLLRYEGLLADQHQMDAGDAHAIMEAAKHLLAAHAYYYTTGAVPDQIRSHSESFNVRYVATRAGSVEFDFFVNVAANGIWDVAKLTFGVFFLDAFRSWWHGSEYIEPPGARLQPNLGQQAPHNSPCFDFSAEEREQLIRLNRRTAQAMHQITIPLGRNAAKLTIYFDDAPLGEWSRRTSKWTIEELEEVARVLKTQYAPGSGLRPHH